MTASSALRTLQLREQFLERAEADRALDGAPFKLLSRLSRRLDFDRFEPVKVEAEALALKLPFSTTADALRSLASLAYLERGPKIGRAWSYRLVLEPLKKAG